MRTKFFAEKFEMRKNCGHELLLVALIALLALIFCSPSAFAQSCPGSTSWNGGTGSWETAGNWSSGVPGASSNACINVASSTVNITASSGDTTLNLDVNLSSDNLNIENNNELIIQAGGNILNNGTINLQSSGSGTWLVIDGNTTLSGTGTVTLSNNTNNLIWADSGTAKLTNQQLIQGAGNIGNGGNFTLVNSGTIDANQSAGLTINPDSTGGITNTGTLEASAGGTLTLTGGAALANTGGVIEATGTGSTVILANTSITGGTLTTASGGVIQSGETSGATPSLTNVTISTGSTLNLSNDDIVNFGAGTITNNGTINMQSSGSGTWIQVNGNVTLSGTGMINMSNNSSNLIFAEGGPATLTNNQTIQGAGGIGNGTALTLINNGTIDATQTTALVINSSAPITNAGTMEATAGGTLQLNGTITNTGALIEASGAGSTIVLANTSITGGTLTTGSGGVIQSGETSGATPSLTNVTISTGSTFDLPNDYIVNFGAGTITNNGTINMQSSGSGTWILIAGSTALSGTGTVTMTNNANNAIYGGGTLTNNETIQGGGTIGNSNLTLFNAHTIDANISGGLLTINPNGGTTNTGTLEATAGGILALDDSINNAGGTILATGTGSIVELANTNITGGTLTSSSGGVFESVETSGATPSLTNVTISSGTVLDLPNNYVITLDAGTITNKGTINLESSGSGTWLQINGAVTLAGTGKVIMSANANNLILGSGTLTNQNTIEGGGNIGDGQIAVVNSGTIEANATKAPFDTLIVDAGGTGFTNNVGTKEGTLSVSKSNVLNIEGPFNNYSGGTLTGGIYKVTGTLEFNTGSTTGIVTNDAAITLTGTTAEILNTDNNSNALTGFADNGTKGTFTVDSGTFTDANAFTNSGIIAAGSGGKFDSTGTLSNFSSSTSTLTGGSYTLTATGQFQFNNQGDSSDIVTNDAHITLAGVDTTKSSIIDQNNANALANYNANGSSGSLTLTTDRNFITPSNFTNAGIVDVEKSTGTGHTQLTVTGNYTQTGGTTTVDGLLTASGAINIQGGFVYGNAGTVAGAATLTGALDFTGGTINPGDGIKKIGVLNVSGTYTESGAGILNIDLDGTTADTKYDVLNVSGTATLGGTLDVDTLTGFTLAAGDSFDILNYASESGTFTTLNLPTLTGGDTWNVNYAGNGGKELILTVEGPAVSKGTATATPAHRVSRALGDASAANTHEPTAILARATCFAARLIGSGSCGEKASAATSSHGGEMQAVASAGTQLNSAHNNVMVATRSISSARGGTSHETSATASAMARLYVCAYLPSTVGHTMGCN
jgi:hypothetical protein